MKAMNPQKSPFQLFIRLYHLLKNAIWRFIDEGFSYHAAALTYTTLLTIVPLLAVIIFFLSWAPIFTTLILSAKAYVATNFLPASSIVIESYFQNFAVQATKLPTFSIVFLIITCLMLVVTLHDTLNKIWGVQKNQNNIYQWLLAVFILFFAPLTVGLSVFLTTYFSHLAWVLEATRLLGLTQAFVTVLSVLVNIIVFTLIYHVMPSTPVRYRDAFFGGLITAFLFEMAKIGFAYYMSRFGNYEVIYGAFAIFPVFLFWLYICWILILFGGLMAFEHSRQSTHH